MKFIRLPLVIGFALLSTTAAASVAEPLRVMVIVDCSATAGSVRWQQFSNAASKLYASLEPGSSLEVHTAERGGCVRRLELQCGTAQQPEALLKYLWSREVTPAAGQRSNILAGFDAAISPLLKSSTANQQWAVVLLLSQSLDKDDAQFLWRRAVLLRQRQWPFYVVGTKNTHPLLLAAAGSGLLHFELVDEADPQSWVKSWSPIQSDPQPKPDAAHVELTSEQLAQLAGMLRQEIAERETAAAVTSSPHSPTDTSTTLPPSIEPPLPLNNPMPDDTSPHAEPSASSDAPRQTLSQPDPETPQPVFEPLPEPISLLPTPDRSLLTSTNADLALSDSTPAPFLPAPDAPAFSESDPEDDTSIARSNPTRRTSAWLWSLLAIPPAAGLIVARTRVAASARRWHQKITARLSNSGSRRDRTPSLLAQYNGHRQDLGSVSRLPRALHIGRSPHTTIRLNRPDIEPRHACLYRKRGRLWLKNLSRKPIRINDQPLPRRRSCPLNLPVRLSLVDGVVINLELN